METTLEGIYRIRIYKIKAGNVFVYTRGQRTDAGTGNGNVFGIL
jgi:hypothetical protein